MDSSTTRSLRQWFDAALAQPLSERQRWLTRHCADTVIRVRVRALLAAHAESEGGPLDTPVAAAIQALHEDEAPAAAAAPVGSRIGAFRLLRLLGEGGMATVFLGEREGADFRQQVAVKLLRRGLYSALEQRLFQRERRMLAGLSHPDIARLIDGGVTEAGIPYLVMDYVDGAPITRHAAERRLDLRARLALFVRVCRAVDAAHRQLVVHRDIKPSNILVTAAGEVKLLDFGIAKLLDDDASGEADATDLPALTPGYAAPEQFAGGPISTATDVYALGVLLHELLLGERPQPRAAKRPSLRIATVAPAQWTLPMTPAAARLALRGDLDTLLLKALAAEPERRYASAGALADDIERHLDHRPILARTPSPWYRARKFVQRHRGGVSIAAALSLAVLASLAVTAWQAQVAQREAQRAQAQTRIAQREAQRANAARDLLVQLFENERPGGDRSALPDTATLLRRGAEHARRDLGRTPALQADMLVAIGRIYDQLSRYDDARPLLQQAVTVARTLPAGERAVLGDALSQLGQLELSQKRYAAAEPHFDRAVLIQRALDPGGLPLALTLHRRALVYSETDRHAEAIAEYRAALALREARLPPRDPLLIRSYGALGTAYVRAHREGEAMPWLQRALALSRQVHGDVHEETARRLNNLGAALMGGGRYPQAERAFAEAVAIARRVYPGASGNVAPYVFNLGSARLALGRLDAAEARLREAIAIEHAIGRAQAPGVGFALAQLAQLQALRGNGDGALRLALEAERILSRALPPAHARRLDAELLVARLRLARRDAPDADGPDADAPDADAPDADGPDLRAAADALRARADALPAPDPALVAATAYVQGLARVRAGDDAAALPFLEDAVARIARAPGLRHDPLSWYATLADVRLRLGDREGARRALRDGEAFADALALPTAHPMRAALRVSVRSER